MKVKPEEVARLDPLIPGTVHKLEQFNEHQRGQQDGLDSAQYI